MSRSYHNKRRLGCGKYLKRLTNRKARRDKNIPNGSGYKKLTSGFITRWQEKCHIFSVAYELPQNLI